MKKADREHLSRVSELGCIVCRNNGYPGTPAEIHHPRSFGSMGRKADHKQAIPLCPHHHRHGGYGEAYHAGAKVWQDRFGTELELLKQVQELLQ